MHLPPQQVIAFTNAQMISYFVTRTANNVGYFKSLNKCAYYLFLCGHVQEVNVCQESSSNTLFVLVICLPEMKKKHQVYNIVIKQAANTLQHCAYALEDFSRQRQLPSYLTSTDKLQTWNQPRP